MDRFAGFAELLLWAALAGGAIPLGAGIARIRHLVPRWLEAEFATP